MTLPTDLPGLLFWYKADAITGKTNGQAITTWPDSGPNGWHITSIVGTAPTYATGLAPNGLPCVNFGGSGYLQLPAAALAAFANKPGATVYAVVSMNTSNHTGYALHVSTGSGGGPARFNLDHKSSAASPRPLEAGARRLDTDSLVSASINGAVADGTWYIESAYADWTNNAIGVRCNSGSWTVVTPAWASGGNSGTANSTEIDIAGNPGSTPTSVAMQIEEIFAYGRVLSSTELSEMDTYLGNRTQIVPTLVLNGPPAGSAGAVARFGASSQHPAVSLNAPFAAPGGATARAGALRLQTSAYQLHASFAGVGGGSGLPGQLDLRDNYGAATAGAVSTFGSLTIATANLPLSDSAAVAGGAGVFGTLQADYVGNLQLYGSIAGAAGAASTRGIPEIALPSPRAGSAGASARVGSIKTAMPIDIQISFGPTDRDRDQWSFGRTDQ